MQIAVFEANLRATAFIFVTFFEHWPVLEIFEEAIRIGKAFLKLDTELYVDVFLLVVLFTKFGKDSGLHIKQGRLCGFAKGGHLGMEREAVLHFLLIRGVEAKFEALSKVFVLGLYHLLFEGFSSLLQQVFVNLGFHSLEETRSLSLAATHVPQEEFLPVDDAILVGVKLSKQ